MIRHPALPETEKISPDMRKRVLKVGQSQENWDSHRQDRIICHSRIVWKSKVLEINTHWMRQRKVK